MTLSFPLDRAGLMDRLRIRDRVFALSESLELTELGSGDVLSADYGPRLWRGTLVLSRLELVEAETIRARIEALQYAQREFEVYDPVIRAPSADRDGSLLGAALPVLFGVFGDNRHLSLSGLPSGYTLTAGDRLSFVTATGSVALHRVVDDTVVADQTGETTAFEVVPHVMPGAAPGDAVTLLRPYCLARIVPGSLNPGRTKGVHVTDMSFDFVQKVQ